MAGSVKGLLFVDYVRMLRARADWSSRLSAATARLAMERVRLDAWYPMSAFEELGLLVLADVAHGDLGTVRAWGRLSAAHLVGALPDLLAASDPRETLMRCHVYRRSFFDFDAVRMAEVNDQLARVQVAYGMSARAEEAACHQTVGFFEGLVEMADGAAVTYEFLRRRWAGDAETEITVSWARAPR